MAKAITPPSIEMTRVVAPAPVATTPSAALVAPPPEGGYQSIVLTACNDHAMARMPESSVTIQKFPFRIGRKHETPEKGPRYLRRMICRLPTKSRIKFQGITAPSSGRGITFCERSGKFTWNGGERCGHRFSGEQFDAGFAGWRKSDFIGFRRQPISVQSDVALGAG